MAKKKKKRRKGIGLVVIEFILGLVIVLIILGAISHFVFTLKDVTVEGTDLYTDAEIENYLLDDKYCDNTLYAFLKNLVFPKGNAEFIDHFEVTITGVHSININCVEKTILGYITNDDLTYIYFNYDGIITQISETYVDGYIKVAGVVSEEAGEGDLLAIGEDNVGYLVSLIKLLEKNNLMPLEVDYDEYGYITLVYENYNISLGSSSYLEEKIDRLSYILPQIEGMAGTLHLENFTPENTDIVFEKDTSEAE